MTEFQYTLNLFVNGAKGIKPKVDATFDVNTILNLANEHNMYYSILSSLCMCDDKDLGLSSEEASLLRKNLKNARLRTYVRMFQLFEILKQFEAEEIPYAVLKGNTVAVLYDDPYSRISGDVDLLVNPEDEKRASALLLKNGFVCEKVRLDDDKHGILRHPVIGLLELHVALYDENTCETWFGAAKDCFKVETEHLSFESLDKICMDDMYFYTLEINKRIEYLFLHNVKHFILGGSSIRAVMDFFLSYTCCSKIDFRLFHQKVKALKFDAIFDAMMGSVLRFLPLEKNEIPYYEGCNDELVALFIKDMETGKWLGYDSEGKTDSSWKLVERANKNAEKNKKSKIGTFFRYVFPSAARLKNNYKYAMKRPCLLPVAWLHRLFRICSGKTVLESAESDKYNRADLLKQFEII